MGRTWRKGYGKDVGDLWSFSGGKGLLGRKGATEKRNKEASNRRGMTAEGMRRKIGWKSRLGGWSGRREPPVAGKDRNRPWTRKSQTLTCCC